MAVEQEAGEARGAEQGRGLGDIYDNIDSLICGLRAEETETRIILDYVSPFCIDVMYDAIIRAAATDPGAQVFRWKENSLVIRYTGDNVRARYYLWSQIPGVEVEYRGKRWVILHYCVYETIFSRLITRPRKNYDLVFPLTHDLRGLGREPVILFLTGYGVELTAAEQHWSPVIVASVLTTKGVMPRASGLGYYLRVKPLIVYPEPGQGLSLYLYPAGIEVRENEGTGMPRYAISPELLDRVYGEKLSAWTCLLEMGEEHHEE